MPDQRIVEHDALEAPTREKSLEQDRPAAPENPKPALVAGKRCSPRVIATALGLIVLFLLFFYVRRGHDVSPSPQPLHQSR